MLENKAKRWIKIMLKREKWCVTLVALAKPAASWTKNQPFETSQDPSRILDQWWRCVAMRSGVNSHEQTPFLSLECRDIER